MIRENSLETSSLPLSAAELKQAGAVFGSFTEDRELAERLGLGKPNAPSTRSVARARLLWKALTRARNAQGAVASDAKTFEDLVYVLEALEQARSEGSTCVTARRFARLTQGRRRLAYAASCLERIGALSRCDAAGRLEGHAFLVAEQALQDGEVERLYSARNFYDELQLAEKIALLARGAVDVTASGADERLTQMALVNRITVVSGGPGTGKTTAVMKMLRALLETDQNLTILLAAPTGKAAGRMQTAVRGQAAQLPDGSVRRILMELEAQTIHRLLTTPDPEGSRPSAANPVDADVLVIDESSMIAADLAMRLFAAVDVERTRVILLGDRFQLAAVGPGSVFADLSDQQGALHPVIEHLTVSHRFAADKTVGMLARAINDGDVPSVTKLLRERTASAAENDNALVWHEESCRNGTLLSAPLKKSIERWVHDYVGEIDRTQRLDKNERAQRLFAFLSDYGVLCAQRSGSMSVEAVNRYADERMTRLGVAGTAWRPVIVRRNDPAMAVNNGDVGVVVPSEAGSGEDVFFPNDFGAGRFVKLALISAWERAFAITIHQSQGSEYHHVAIVLPDSKESALATRELLYTAVTRVKDVWENGQKYYGTLDVYGTQEVVEQSVKTPVERDGGLAMRLRQCLGTASGEQ